MTRPLCMTLLPDTQDVEPGPEPGSRIMLNFGASTARDDECRGLHIPLSLLHGPELECWCCRFPLASRQSRDAVHVRANDELLLGCLRYDESLRGGIVAATRQAYHAIRSLLDETGFPHLARIWHFFPRINQEEARLERYRGFCLGRAEALQEWNLDESRLPAATAIGSHTEGLVIHFLATRFPGIQIENPRQVSAYCYPEQYGPRSPTFSRATLVPWPDGTRQLFISGTASIVGHETLHAGDLEAQLDETLRNIDTLIGVAREQHGLPLAGIAALDLIRVYVRHREDAPRLQALLERRLPAGPPRVLLHGDICRADLLLEIEGAWTGCAA